MSSTPATDIVEPSAEPERDLHRRLRERFRVVAEAIDTDAADDDTFYEVRVDMADAEKNRILNEIGKPSLDGLPASINAPTIDNNNFEIKAGTISMLQNAVQFYGKDHEDPSVHIAGFIEVCATFRIRDASADAIRLRLFPFSLRDGAKEWLLSLPAGSITTWNQLAEKFLQKYFPPEKTVRLRTKILNFRQDEDESLYEAWERFKELMRKVPHHGLPKWQQCQIFYHGLDSQGQMMIDTYSGGDIGTKNATEAFEILEKCAVKNRTQQPPRGKSSRQGVHHVDDYTAMTARMDALSSKFDRVMEMHSRGSSSGGAYQVGDFSTGEMSHEHVDFMGNQYRPQNNPYSNTYNPGWKNHPNFSWKPDASNQHPPGFAPRPTAPTHGAYGPPRPQQPPPSSDPSVHDMLSQILAGQNTQKAENEKRFREYDGRFTRHESELKSQKASMQAIENQVGQIAKMLSARQQGGLPSNTEPNPNATAKAITLRSGKTAQAIPPAVSEKPVDDEEVDEEIEAESPGEVQQRRVPASTARPKEPVREYVPPVPYPGRLKKQKMEEHYGKFLELFKQLHINLPFVEALAQMPKYAKFLKDILSNKKKLEELSQVTLNEECSAVLQNKLPKKMNDPGSFTIPCLIGSLSVSNALADLGASINLMPYAVFAKLDLGEPKPTRMSIQLADRSVKYPRGIVENMLVKIDKFVFPVDFVILDMDEDKNVPLILGRPFLATARALIDVCTGRLTLRVDDEEVTFDIGKSMQHSQSQDDTLYFIETIDTYVSDHLHATFEEDVMDTQLLGGETFGSPSVDRMVEEVTCLIGHASPPCPEVFEVVDRVTEPKARPSIEDPPSVELKELPDHLEYAFLEGETHLPVIISAGLSKEEKDRLLEVLK
ncbi:putative retrotransposon gag domain, aspartic peptidase domain superfamily [Helianthus annuus]|nr:putative retrotransposon gag domain, aspartic peptidase domain superfamily [Helianthus annuus]